MTGTNNGKTLRETAATILFCGLLVVIGVASISQLRWSSPSVHMASSFGGGYDLTYATVLALAVVVLAAGAHLVSGGRRFLAWLCGVEVLLAGALVVSTVFASDRRLAVNGAAGLMVSLILMHAVYVLTDRPWKVRAAVIVLVGLGTMFAAKTWLREWYETDETWENYQQTRESFWAARGTSLDDPTVKLYEARLKSRDNGGFFFHGNLGAAYLATVLMVATGAVSMRAADSVRAYRTLWLALQGALVVFIASALVITYSKGAMLAGGGGVACAVVLLVFGRRLAWRVNVSAAVCCVLVVGGLAATVGYGLSKKTLPTLSMAYRWQYWRASYGMFADHPLTGVGAGNYGYYYLRYKLAEAEEEVSSPHNFIVQGLTEYGVVGGTALAVLPGVILLTIGRSAARPSRPDARRRDGPAAGTVMLGVGAAVFGVVFVFNQLGLDDFRFMLVYYLPYILIFAGSFVIGAFRGERLGAIDDTFGPTGKLVGGPVVIWLAAGLVTFTAGNLVNFSLFEPSMQFLFFFLAGLTLAAVNPRVRVRSWRPAAMRSGALAVFAVAYLVCVVVPAGRAEQAVADAGHVPGVADPRFDRSYQRLLALAGRYGDDAHLPAQAARRLLTLPAYDRDQSVRHTQRAADLYGQAAERAEKVYRFYRAGAQCYLRLAELDPARRDELFDRAERLYEKALALAPRSRILHFQAGMTYWRRGRHVSKAKEHLAEALRLDDALAPDSLRRFSADEIRRIRDVLTRIDGR